MYKRGEYSITILEKSYVVPAPDAASTDINKVIRSGDYADPAIAALNVDAVNEWRKPEWEGTYHECVDTDRISLWITKLMSGLWFAFSQNWGGLRCGDGLAKGRIR
jgi:hypothetical protein